MGSLCSKADAHTQAGGHQVLGGGQAASNDRSIGSRRDALAAAAESRRQKELNRGTVPSDRNKPIPKPTTTDNEREQEPLRWD